MNKSARSRKSDLLLNYFLFCILSTPLLPTLIFLRHCKFHILAPVLSMCSIMEDTGDYVSWTHNESLLSLIVFTLVQFSLIVQMLSCGCAYFPIALEVIFNGLDMIRDLM